MGIPENNQIEQKTAGSAKDRLQKLKELRTLKRQSSEANRKELYKEHQQKQVDAKVRQKLEAKQRRAEEELERLDAEEKGEDYDRKKAWDWSIEDTERWDAKQKRGKRKAAGFQNYVQLAESAYEKDLEQIGPNREAYERQMEKLAEKLESGQDYQSAINEIVRTYKPENEEVDTLVQKLAQANERRLKRRKNLDSDDSGFINDKNKQFNDNLNRHYDAYTKDIREALERGTAL